MAKTSYSDWLTAARLWHSEAQSRPHPLEGTRHLPMRTAPRGSLVARFFLRLDEAKPRNRTRKESALQASEDRQKMLANLALQLRMQRELICFPISGRPLVLCTRYSSTEPDATAGWGKLAVDCLQPSGERTYTRVLKKAARDEALWRPRYHRERQSARH